MTGVTIIVAAVVAAVGTAVGTAFVTVVAVVDCVVASGIVFIATVDDRPAFLPFPLADCASPFAVGTAAAGSSRGRLREVSGRLDDGKAWVGNVTGKIETNVPPLPLPLPPSWIGCC